jgi:hypothetical protein
MALDVEEIPAEQVCITHRHRRVHRRSVDRDVDLRRLTMKRINSDGARDDVKRPRTSVNIAYRATNSSAV